ncbi:MAG: SMC-Scp complex subunit ScpB [Phycisphaerae bacterium]|nr:SMC-Scp complex subunit ScpB [Phycisphaerae bacterium]
MRNHFLVDEARLKSIIEALLFASDEPLSAGRLADVVGDGATSARVRRAVEALVEEYKNEKRSFTVEELAGGYQFFSLPEFNAFLRRLGRARREAHISQAAVETLAIVAYRQPITRAEIEDIRGVAAGDMLRSLIEKGLARVMGKAEQLGHPLLYGTTKKFLQFFGLKDLKDLPKVGELAGAESAAAGLAATAEPEPAEDGPSQEQDSPVEVAAEETADPDEPVEENQGPQQAD